jgi:DNA invertase Pin-like site-specific DNA recombinase
VTARGTSSAPLREVPAHWEEKGWTIFAVERDVASGANRNQAGLDRALSMVERSEADVLLAHALDRISRDQNYQGLVLSEAEHAVVIWDSTTEDIDNTPTDKILRAVIGDKAELELLKIAEPTNRGKQARVESGKYNVGCRAPFGYR